MNIAVLCPGPSLPRYWREQIAWSLVADWTGLHELPVTLNCSHHDPAAAKAIIVHEHGEKKWSRIA